MTFRYYDAEKVIMGKKMKRLVEVSMAGWHTLCAEGWRPIRRRYETIPLER